MSKSRMCAVVFASVIAASALPVNAQATESETVDEIKRKIKVCIVAIERAEKEINALEAKLAEADAKLDYCKERQAEIPKEKAEATKERAEAKRKGEALNRQYSKARKPAEEKYAELVAKINKVYNDAMYRASTYRESNPNYAANLELQAGKWRDERMAEVSVWYAGAIGEIDAKYMPDLTKLKDQYKSLSQDLKRLKKEAKDRKVEQGRLGGQIKRIQRSVETRTTGLASSRTRLSELQTQLRAAGGDND